MTLLDTDRRPVQRRTVLTLLSTQLLGGVGLSAGIAVGALLAEQVSGSTAWAGVGSTLQVLGAALIAIPVARVTARRGRRPALVLGYGLAVLGAIGLITAGVTGSFPLLLAASILFGGATTSNSQSRYAAADLADPAHRGRDLSVVVWATTLGSVLGPNLVGPAGSLARVLHLPPLTGPYVVSIGALTLAALVLAARLRPDPLLLARELSQAGGEAAHDTRGSVVEGLKVILASAPARVGLVALAVGHAVMVGVMIMTPLHMEHGHAELTVIGFVISVHILGMYALSPVTGWAVDRFGPRPVALVGSLVLAVATFLASLAPQGWSWVLLLGLFLLGLGWSGTMIAGSTLMVSAIPLRDRPAAQGASDVAMGVLAALAGIVGGVVVAHASYRVLSLLALGFALLVTGVVGLARPTPRVGVSPD